MYKKQRRSEIFLFVARRSVSAYMVLAFYQNHPEAAFANGVPTSFWDILRFSSSVDGWTYFHLC